MNRHTLPPDERVGQATQTLDPRASTHPKLVTLENSYSQVKWIFSTKMALHKTLVLFKLNSHAKMAPDNRLDHETVSVWIERDALSSVIEPVTWEYANDPTAMTTIKAPHPTDKPKRPQRLCSRFLYAP